MLRPSIFNSNFVDSMFDDIFSFPAKTIKKVEDAISMKTDVKVVNDNYELSIDLPGYKKEDIKAQLKDGYLTISAEKNEEVNEEAEDGKYIHRERYCGSCKRSFFVGEDLEMEDVKASYENGVLMMVFPKDKKKEVVEEEKYISIL
ncbi:MAG: Hsp20/alpha crystallin family protein [Eubacteriales bacterium]|nr:Hsp20/alpha crystallin family protein [Eubacteriales bacterium]